MNKKLLIAGLVASVLFIAFGFLSHGMLLTGEYSLYPQLLRPNNEAMARMPYMLLAHVIMGFAFAWIYSQGVNEQAEWLPQGVRFGIAVTLLVILPWYMVHWSVEPWGWMTVAKQIALDAIGILIIGIVTAFIFKPATSAPADTGQGDAA